MYRARPSTTVTDRRSTSVHRAPVSSALLVASLNASAVTGTEPLGPSGGDVDAPVRPLIREALALAPSGIRAVYIGARTGAELESYARFDAARFDPGHRGRLGALASIASGHHPFAFDTRLVEVVRGLAAIALPKRGEMLDGSDP